MNKISFFGFTFLMTLLTSYSFAADATDAAKENESNANFRNITCKVTAILNQPADGTLVITQKNHQSVYNISIDLTSKDKAYSVASSSNPILANLLENNLSSRNKIEFSLVNSPIRSPAAPTVVLNQNGTLTIDQSNGKNITALFIGFVAYQGKLLGKTKIDSTNCKIK